MQFIIAALRRLCIFPIIASCLVAQIMLLALAFTFPLESPETQRIVTPAALTTKSSDVSSTVRPHHRLPITVPNPTSPAVGQSYVTRPIDIPENNWLPGHRVVDLSAKPGDEIVASLGGVVAFAGVVAGTPIVSIDHPDGLRTTYEPVETRLEKGETVRRGRPIGVLANAAELPDTARKPNGLSWGAKIGDQYIDPFDLLGGVRVRLLA